MNRQTNVSSHPRKGTKGVKQHSRSLPDEKTVPHNPPEEDIKESTRDECIDAFEKILELSEDLPLQHEKNMSVEDTIRELVSTMPPEWQKKNIVSCT